MGNLKDIFITFKYCYVKQWWYKSFSLSAPLRQYSACLILQNFPEPNKTHKLSNYLGKSFFSPSFPPSSKRAFGISKPNWTQQRVHVSVIMCVSVNVEWVRLFVCLSEGRRPVF